MRAMLGGVLGIGAVIVGAALISEGTESWIRIAGAVALGLGIGLVVRMFREG